MNKLLKMYVPLNEKYLFYKQTTLKHFIDVGRLTFTTSSKLNYQQFSMNNNYNINNRGIFKSRFVYIQFIYIIIGNQLYFFLIILSFLNKLLTFQSFQSVISKKKHKNAGAI